MVRIYIFYNVDPRHMLQIIVDKLKQLYYIIFNMNTQHKLTKKLNRYNRLKRTTVAMPTDGGKKDRKHSLESELKTAKLIK